MIIGLTGTKASGKGEIAEILKKRGFIYSSLSDRVREEAVFRGLNNYTIKELQDIGNELREKFGNEIWAKKTLELIKEQGKNFVIDGIRNLGEIEEFKKQGNFFLIAVDAPQKNRFEWLIKRGRESDPKTYEEFLVMDGRDKGLAELDTGQQVIKCMEQADFELINDRTLEEMQKRVEDLYEKILSKIPRPSWDEYFMEISRAVAKRATCDRGKSGCVIVRDKHILVTGYVGSPAGLPHCDEVGHQMKTMIHEDGSETMHCVRTAHAEQNAICQAAKLGVNLNGSTLYCKMTPCSTCAKMIINTGIKRVVAEKDYHASADSKEMFKQAGIRLEILNEEIEQYSNNTENKK